LTVNQVPKYAGRISIDIVERDETVLDNIVDTSALNPTVFYAVNQLIGCTAIFGEIIDALGAGLFIEAAYAYTLGGSPKESEKYYFTKKLAKKVTSLFCILEEISLSDEFSAQQRILPSPPCPTFLFRSVYYSCRSNMH